MGEFVRNETVDGGLQCGGSDQMRLVAVAPGMQNLQGYYSAAIFLIPICISFDTAEKRRYATYLILNRRFSFEF